MNTHDHAAKKQIDKTPDQLTQDKHAHDDVSELSNFLTVQRALNKQPTPKTMLQLQRTIGNSGTKRLLAANTIQRVQGSKNALAEKEYVIVAAGEKIKWTDLVGGCIAFAFKYKDGGGMGYHMVMNDSETAQWNELLSKVTIPNIASIHLFSDQLDSTNGWRVPLEYEDFIAGKPKAGRIRSTLDLKANGINENQYKDYIENDDTYWSHTWGSIKEWMGGIFGVKPTYEGTMKNVEYTF